MRVFILLSILALSPALVQAQPAYTDPGGVLHQLTVARFGGSGTQSIQAMTSDAAGNVYVAGTTSSFDFPTKNAAQPTIGESVLMRSLDRGATWQKVNAPPVTPITVTPHPKDPQTLLVGAVDGIYKTTDGGQSWKHVYSWAPLAYAGEACGECMNIAFDPANTSNVYTYVLGNSFVSQLLASTDGGESWQARSVASQYLRNDTLSGVPLMWVDPNGSGTLALGAWLSSDGGMTWASMTQPSAEQGISYTVPDPRHRGWIYAATVQAAGGSLFLSKDWGATWTQRPAPSFFSANYLLLDPDYANPVYSVAAGSLYESNDAGQSWHASGPPGNVSYYIRLAVLSRSCGGGALLVPSFGGVSSSFDFGLTWPPPQLSREVDLAAGAGCAVYAVRTIAADAFVAKLAPGGSEVLWSTFLGGSDLDTAAAIALDAQGNVYVTGNTASSDFPATQPRVGTHGKQNVFATKLDSAGRLIYSVVIGGESRDNASSLAVDAHGDAHIVGWTDSKSFPVTQGAFQTKAGDADGFAVKFGPAGAIAYASYLPEFGEYYFDPYTIDPPQVIAVVAETRGSILIGGPDGRLSRMSPNGASLTALPNQPGPIFDLESDKEGNIYVAEQVTGPNTGSGSCFQGFYEFDDTAGPGDVLLVKLRASDLQQIYSTRLFGDCKSWPVAVKVAPTGEAAVSLWTLDRFHTRSPLLPFSGCGLRGSAVVARVSADGSTDLFSSFLDMCGPGPPLAFGADGAIYAGVTAGPHSSYLTSTATGVLRIPRVATTGPYVQEVFNSFSGSNGFATPGVLLTILGQDLSSKYIDLGFGHSGALPTELAGTRVLFDGTPAEIQQVAPYRIICVVPADVAGKISVTVKVVNGPLTAVPFVLLNLLRSDLGLWTRAFPGRPVGSADGVIRNADGTLNSAEHPAAPGSTITMFATGLAAPGDVNLLWDAPPLERFTQYSFLTGTARRMHGFIDAVWAIDFQIPDAPGPGVYVVPTPGVLGRHEIEAGSGSVGVYVK